MQIFLSSHHIGKQWKKKHQASLKVLLSGFNQMHYNAINSVLSWGDYWHGQSPATGAGGCRFLFYGVAEFLCRGQGAMTGMGCHRLLLYGGQCGRFHFLRSGQGPAV